MIRSRILMLLIVVVVYLLEHFKYIWMKGILYLLIIF